MAFAFCVAYVGLCSTSDPKQPTHFLPKVCYSITRPISCICTFSYLQSNVQPHIFYLWTLFFSGLSIHFVQIILNCSFHLTHIYAVSQVLTAAISLQVLQTSILTTCLYLFAKLQFKSSLPFWKLKAPPASLLLN